DQLNRFTTVFAARFNIQHGQGYGLSGAGNHIPFFNLPPMDYASYPDMGYEKVDPASLTGASDSEIIANYEKANPGKMIFRVGDDWYAASIVKGNEIDISDGIKNSLNNIAAASTHDGSGSGLPGDGSNALKLSDLRNDVKMFTWGSPDDFFKSLISNLGVDTQEAIRMTENQEVLINQIENSRQAISGVSLDEEMTNMVRFQHSYNAAARMITAIDEMLDKIINGMGVVGR
ncbi:MAG TPA: hypothetical protein GX503_08345, partial [Clostridiales bacterium]|nr:hypothetical protein [Clostridiales bacterium]